MNIFKKPLCSVLLQYILLPVIACTPLFANSSPNGNQGQENGKGNQKIHGNKGNQNKDKSNKENGNQHQQLKHAKSNKYYDKQRGSNVSFGHVRPLAIEYGLTGYQGLPPGIAKQVSRGKPLPPGIAKKVLPSPFLAQLPVYVGYEWKVSGQDLILVAIGTAVVAEIIENVFE